jgi:hypothetical protein
MMFSHQALTILVLSGFALYAAAQCDDFKIEVTQQGSVLVPDGAIPIIEVRDVEAFYNLVGTPEEVASYEGTVVPAVSDRSFILVHQDSSTCEKSLVIVHDARVDGSGGKARFFITGNMTDPTVDDNLNGIEYITVKDKTKMRWIWDECCTDGVALPLDLEDASCITVEPKFEGITEWKYVSEDDAGALVYTTLDMDEDLVLCYAEAEDIIVPENCEDNFCPNWYNLLCWFLWWLRCSVFPGGGQ